MNIVKKMVKTKCFSYKRMFICKSRLKSTLFKVQIREYYENN